ncbi:MAG: TonB-dependent receptor [Novosphingobium sp.]|nr:TonB-dependent receptor [Novosphingobium sp.]
MNKPRLATLLLLSSALAMPTLAFAQDTTEPDTQEPSSSNEQIEETTPPAADEAPDVSLPGEIVVTGTRSRNITKVSDQVISVLSTEQIARTGEGNIAGALGRVTGLSVVGSGFVYVRGLGDRYSLALLNGSPLPSPEPLRRVVPLDLFPTNVVASSLVQKSYSANFPGEFGGGVINLTTTAVPKESFLTISAGISGDGESTGQFGYSYFGAKSDWTGFDNGSRDAPPALASFFASGSRISDIDVDRQAIGGELVRFSRATLQKVGNLPVNYSASITGGTSFDVGDATLGVIATAGFSNKWTNRDIIAQTTASPDLSEKEADLRRVVTDNRIVVNGLLGLGAEFGDHKVRLTGLYIRDTIKEGRLATGTIATSGPNITQMFQDTAWFERQLFDAQFVGEFRFGNLGVDLRGSYAKSQREAPYETAFQYVRTNNANDPYGNLFINRLGQNPGGSASVSFSDLDEDLWFGGIDLTYRLNDRVGLSAGYSYTDTKRTSSRREFQFRASSDLPTGVSALRPDLLLAPGIIDFYDINLIETTESDPAFAAGLTIHGGYVKANLEPFDGLSLDFGVRYEDAEQTVDPVQVFAVPSNSGASTLLANSYWLPSATVTWEFAPQMQLRFNASQTIARPQFRELIFQQYYDPESDRLYRGNPLLGDSKLTNAEARFEWYFAPDERLSVAGFYKDIKKPIEAFAAFNDNSVVTSYANAPKAQLYGAELEVQKYFDLGDWMGPRRLVAIANYTYTQSKIKVGSGDLVEVFGTTAQPAENFFRDGAPLTGQSDHIANLQFGIENTDRLEQLTMLLTYASTRVVSRGPVGLPDIIEKPGLRLDVVARESAKFLGQEVDLKVEVRNILGTRHQEYQSNGTNRIDINTYDQATSLAASISVKF